MQTSQYQITSAVDSVETRGDRLPLIASRDRPPTWLCWPCCSWSSAQAQQLAKNLGTDYVPKSCGCEDRDRLVLSVRGRLYWADMKWPCLDTVFHWTRFEARD